MPIMNGTNATNESTDRLLNRDKLGLTPYHHQHQNLAVDDDEDDDKTNSLNDEKKYPDYCRTLKVKGG